MLTPGTGPYSINESLVQNLTAQPWAQAVSPEIFSLGTLGGAPAVIRGVDPATFLRIEGASSGPPSNLTPPWALAGSGLASRLALVPGQELTLVGSSIPRLDVVPLAGTFRTSTAADDELLVDYATARFLTGVGLGVYHSIRVETSEPTRLVAFLAARTASVHVAGPGGNVGGVNSAPLPADPRVINLFLRYGLGPLPLDYVAEGVTEAANSVQVVAWGLETFMLLLVACGIHAVQARAFADRRPTVGVLRALGAPGTWLRLQALRELLPLAAAAGALGAVLGAVGATLLTPSAAIVAFGHEVRVTLGPIDILLVAVSVVLVSAVSELGLLQGAMRERPSESIRGSPVRQPPRSLEVVLRE
ncbi:MAG TPA: FtsX-like permease family protein [Thermoplasmata archaeon]|nr:FtsX-like permease family protein [Thermoplasmata archaeon]